MTALTRLAAILIGTAMLAACAAAPAPKLAPLSGPLVTSSGLVIGTFSYQYVDTGARADDAGWVVHFERIDAPGAQDYAIAVDVDQHRRSGVFAATLPAGVYAFREAERAGGRYGSGVMKMPFEVEAGAVRDAGHYAVDPLGAK